jgi:hypothetical protein
VFAIFEEDYLAKDASGLWEGLEEAGYFFDGDWFRCFF